MKFNHTVFSLFFFVIFSSFLCVDAQNIGINNDGSAGSTLLHTKNTAAATDNILRIENTIGTQKSGINLLNSTTANANWLFYVPASSTDLRLQLYTGTDAVTFLNNGNVGIGTITPTGPLSVVATSTSANYHDRDITVFYYPNNAGSSGGFSAYKARGTAAAPTAIVNGDFTGRITFGAHDGTSWVSSAHIAAIVNGTVAAGSIPQDLTFRTGTSGAGTEWMRLLSTGNFGIGTAAPLSKLHTAGNLTVGGGAAVGSVGNVQITTGGASPISNRLTFGTDGTGWKFSIGENQGGTVSEFMTFQDNGNIGIGTTAPTALLHTNLSTQSTATVNSLLISRWTRPQTPAVKWGNAFDILLGSYGTTVNSESRVDFKLANGATDLPDATVMTLQGNGNVGIGTTSPATKLDITSNSTGGIRAYGPVNGVTNGMLQVSDNDGAAAVAWPGGGHITIWPSGTGLGIMRFQKSGISTWGIIDRSTANSSAGRILAIHDANGVGDIMTFLGSGNVGIGTTSPDTKLHVAGGNGTTLKIVDGNQAAGKVLTSDAAGVASWSNPAAEVEFPCSQISNQFWTNVNWNTCVNNCKNYNGTTAGDGGFTDWRTPDIAEYLYSVLNLAAPTGGWQGVYFWTRDPDVTTTPLMEIFNEAGIAFAGDNYTSTFNKCRCVR